MEKIWGVLKFSVCHLRVSNRPEVATVQPLYSSEEEPGRKLFIKACDLWLDLFLFDSLSGFTIKYADCTLSSHRWNRSIGRTVCFPIFVQKELYLIVFVRHLNFRQPKNSKRKRNISAINCRFCQVFWRRSRSVRTISFEVSKSLAANTCTFHCTVKVL